MTTEEDTMNMVSTGVGLSVLGLGAGMLLKNISNVSTPQRKRKKVNKRRK